MVKTLQLKLVLLLCMIMGAGTAWADEVVVYTLDGTVTGGSSGYATESEITQDNITWMVTGNTTMSPWRIGGKNLNGVDRPLYSTSAVSSENISKVVVSNGSKTLTAVNSMTLIVSSNADFSNPTSTVTGTFTANSTTTFERPTGADWSDKYFKLVYNVTAGSSNQYAQFEKAEFYKQTGGTVTPTCATPTFSPAAGTYTSAQNVTISSTTTGATIYYTLDGTAPTTSSSVYSGAISITATTTIKAMAVASGYDNSSVAEATYTIVNIEHAGTQADPYTVADARNAIDANTGLADVYATGIVTAIPTAWSTDYNNITFNIVDNSGDTEFLQAYRCVSTNDADASTVAVGDVVVVKGTLTKYGTTYEFGQGCQLVSLTHSNPYFTASDVNVDYNATGGSITYTVENGVQGGSVTASTTSEWLTLGSNFASPISFTCSTNTNGAARTATVTLTYTYNTNQTVTKDVTVTQAGNPNTTDNISSITEVGTAYSVKGTVVATNSRGFVMGDGTGYVYYYKNAAVTQSVGDMVTVSGTTGTYGQIIQFTNTATVAEAQSSNYNNTPAATVVTAVPDYSTGYHLSTYLQFEGTLTKSSNNYFISLGQEQIQVSYPTSDQGTALTALDGKNVRVKGYFTGINSSSKFTVMLESVEEVVSTEPTITATPASLTGFTYEEGNGPSATKTISVSGTNLEDNILLSLGNSSDFEMCLTADGTYANSITLNHNSGEVAATTVYVRLKEGLAVGDSYSGTITLTSEDADNVTVSLAGSVTAAAAPHFTWDLSTNSYSSSSTSKVTWTDEHATMTLERSGSSTNADNYLGGGSYTHTRFYKNQLLTITPASGYKITSVVFEATTSSYANGVSGGTWTNATASKDNKEVTVTPTNGEQAITVTISESSWITGVTVYYETSTTPVTNYTLTVANPANVTINASYDATSVLNNGDNASVASGTEVTFSVTVANGYTLDGVTVTGTEAGQTITPTESNGTYTFTMPAYNVTINASATASTVTPTTGSKYALFSGDLEEGDYIIYYDGKAMKNSVSSNGRLDYEEVTPVSDVITTDDATIVWHIAPSGSYWTIYSADADAYAAGTGVKNKAQMLDDGTDDMALWTVSGTETYDFVNKANAAANVNANLRNNGTYGFACYATTTGGALSLYKLQAASSVTITIKANRQYTGFSCDKALDFEGTGLTAQIVTSATGTSRAVTKVPANTGLIVGLDAVTTTQQEIAVPVYTGTATDDVAGNMLVPILTATTIAQETTDYVNYVFGKAYDKEQFFKIRTGGMEVPANNVYLAVPKNAAKDLDVIGFGGDATSINALETETVNGNIYNLQGQKVNRAQKGIYIVNGRKVVIK